MFSRSLFSLTIMLAASGCYGYDYSVGAAPVTGAEIEVGPPGVEIETAPQVYYEGHPTYWYGNRWYYRRGSTWHSYRSEPAYLQEHRRRHFEHHEHDR